MYLNPLGAIPADLNVYRSRKLNTPKDFLLSPAEPGLPRLLARSGSQNESVMLNFLE
jgi:hypothetical protein